MSSWWEILSVFLLSTVKFVFGSVPLALGLGFSFLESFTVTSLGGFFGVTSFVLMSDKLIEKAKKRRAQLFLEHPERPRPHIFTKKRRFIIKVKHRFGLVGIALLTPFILSIPLGCFLAVRYFKDKQRILIFMYSAIMFWSASTYYLYKPVFNAIRAYFL